MVDVLLAFYNFPVFLHLDHPVNEFIAKLVHVFKLFDQTRTLPAFKAERFSFEVTDSVLSLSYNKLCFRLIEILLLSLWHVGDELKVAFTTVFHGLDLSLVQLGYHKFVCFYLLPIRG